MLCKHPIRKMSKVIVAEGNLSICREMKQLVLIEGGYMEPISHISPARSTSNHSERKRSKRKTQPHLHVHTLINTVGCSVSYISLSHTDTASLTAQTHAL